MIKAVSMSVFTAVIICVSVAAWAEDQAACGLIQDHDQRAYCFAKATNNQSTCGTIQNHDLRTRCFAEVSGR